MGQGERWDEGTGRICRRPPCVPSDLEGPWQRGRRWRNADCRGGYCCLLGMGATKGRLLVVTARRCQLRAVEQGLSIKQSDRVSLEAPWRLQKAKRGHCSSAFCRGQGSLAHIPPRASPCRITGKWDLSSKIQKHKKHHV